MTIDPDASEDLDRWLEEQSLFDAHADYTHEITTCCPVKKLRDWAEYIPAASKAGSGAMIMTPHLWLWSAGPKCGLSDDEQRARDEAEKAALDGGCPAALSLVTVGLGPDLEPVSVHTDIAYSGQAVGDRVAWRPELWEPC